MALLGCGVAVCGVWLMLFSRISPAVQPFGIVVTDTCLILMDRCALQQDFQLQAAKTNRKKATMLLMVGAVRGADRLLLCAIGQFQTSLLSSTTSLCTFSRMWG